MTGDKALSQIDDIRSGLFYRRGVPPLERHEHKLPDGRSIYHRHGHLHSHTQTAQVLKRLKTIGGHIEGIANMVEEGRDCSEVLIQLSAVTAAVRKLKILILKDHVEHCVVDAICEGDTETLNKLRSAIDKMME